MPDTPQMMNRDALLDSVAAATTRGMEASEAARARALLDELVADWFREAGTDADAPAVIDLLRREHEAAIAQQPAGERLELVRAAVLDRRIRRVGVQTFELGKLIIDGGVDREAARARGRELMTALDALAAELRAITHVGTRAQLGRDLQEASMEALFAIEGEAMSLRLGHYARDAAAPSVS